MPLIGLKQVTWEAIGPRYRAVLTVLDHNGRLKYKQTNSLTSLFRSMGECKIFF